KMVVTDTAPTARTVEPPAANRASMAAKVTVATWVAAAVAGVAACERGGGGGGGGGYKSGGCGGEAGPWTDDGGGGGGAGGGFWDVNQVSNVTAITSGSSGDGSVVLLSVAVPTTPTPT